MGIISITFDEGRESQFEKAFPILEKEGIKATVYLLTGFLGRNWNAQNCKLQIINKRQVKKLFDSGWEIASHTSNHSNLIFASKSRARKEFEDSKKRLNEMGIGESGISYPGGVINQENYEIVKNYFTYGREASNTNWNKLKVFNLNNVEKINSFRLRGNIISENCVGRLNIEKYFKEIKYQDKWIILVFHDIRKNVTNKDDTTSLNYFNEIIKLIKKFDLKVKTVSEVMKEYQLPVLKYSSDEFMTMADYAELNFGKRWLFLPLYICYRFSLLEILLNLVLRVKIFNPHFWFIEYRNKDFNVEETMKYYNKYFLDQQEYQIPEWRKSYLKRMFKLLKIEKNIIKNKNMRFLDIGTGIGTTVIECVKNNLISFGIDFSPVAIKKANILADKLLSNEQRKRVCFKIASAEKLPFDDNYFDKICSIAVLEYVKDDMGAFDEIQRVVKIGGRIFILVSNKKPLFFSLIVSLTERNNAKKLRYYKAEEFIKEFEKRGFVLEDLAYHGHWPKLVQFFLQKILPTSGKSGYKIWWYLEKLDQKYKNNPLSFTFSIVMAKK